MTERKLIVRKTAERNNIDGDFIAQFNPSVIKEMKLTPGEYIIIKNRIDEREFKIAALLQSNDKANKNEIHIDQKIRNAIGVTPKDEHDKDKLKNIEVEIEKPKSSLFRKRKSWFSRYMGIQTNILRVKFASFSDMEINICRLNKLVMQSIGVEEGDIIVVASTSNKIEIRAFELTNSMIEKRMFFENNKKSLYYRGHEIREKLRKHRATVYDLPWILLDFDARNKLGVKTSDPVRVYRSVRYAIYNKLHLVSIPLVLTIIGFIISFDKITTTPQKIIIYLLGLFIILLLHLLTIRKKVK